MHSHLLTIQQYAIKYKLSTFTVIKQVNSGKLKTIKKVTQLSHIDSSKNTN